MTAHTMVALCLLVLSMMATISSADLAINFIGEKAPLQTDGCDDADAAAKDDMGELATECTKEATGNFYGIQDQVSPFTSVTQFLELDTGGRHRKLLEEAMEQASVKDDATRGNLRSKNTSPMPNPFDQHRKLQGCSDYCEVQTTVSQRYFCCIIHNDGCSYCQISGGGGSGRRDRRLLAARKLWNEGITATSPEQLIGSIDDYMVGHINAIKRTCLASFQTWITDNEFESCFGAPENAQVDVIDLEMAQ